MSDIKKSQQNIEDKKATRQAKKADKKAARKADRQRIRDEKRKDREEFFKIEDALGFMKILNIACIVMLVIALFLGVRYVINFAAVQSYKHGNYSPSAEVFLSKVNIPEGYVPTYNAGNAFYRSEDYDNAISYYQSALESHPTEKKECDIRVNLALAMLHKIDWDNLETEKQKAAAARQLQSARNILCETGCADPYGTNGHDPEAEQLKQDIDKMLEELGVEPEPPSDDGEGDEKQNQGGSGQDNQQTRREQQLQKDLNNQKQDAMDERRKADQEQQNEMSRQEKEQQQMNPTPQDGESQDGNNGDYTDYDNIKNW